MKLKPCPFCGGEAETRYLYCRPYIICSKCHARIPCYNTYPKAAKAWNRREPMDRIVKRLEKQKELREKELLHIKYKSGFSQATNKAIEIVKGGAV